MSTCSLRPTAALRPVNLARAWLLSLVLLPPFPAWARIDPWTWEELVLEADLVGVVECVLLSNSAKASGVPLPQEGGTEVEAWWREHGEKVRIHDPWLEMLDEQKVD